MKLHRNASKTGAEFRQTAGEDETPGRIIIVGLILVVTILLCLFLVRVTQAADVIVCPVCHTENPPDANFCRECGAVMFKGVPGTGHLPIAPPAEESKVQPPAKPTTQVNELIRGLSDQDLRRLVVILMEQQQQARPTLDSNSVATMSRADLEALIRRVAAENAAKNSASGGSIFMQSLGGGVLILLFIAIISVL